MLEITNFKFEFIIGTVLEKRKAIIEKLQDGTFEGKIYKIKRTSLNERPTEELEKEITNTDCSNIYEFVLINIDTLKELSYEKNKGNMLFTGAENFCKIIINDIVINIVLSIICDGYKKVILDKLEEILNNNIM